MLGLNHFPVFDKYSTPRINRFSPGNPVFAAQTGSVILKHLCLDLIRALIGMKIQA
jgi:hypothetical protein